jgi:hypothetical protein
LVTPTAHGKFDESVSDPNVAKAPINLAAPMSILEHWLDKPSKAVKSLKPVHCYRSSFRMN